MYPLKAYINKFVFFIFKLSENNFKKKIIYYYLLKIQNNKIHLIKQPQEKSPKNLTIAD